MCMEATRPNVSFTQNDSSYPTFSRFKYVQDDQQQIGINHSPPSSHNPFRLWTATHTVKRTFQWRG